MFLPHNMAAVKPLYSQCAYMCKSFLHQKKDFSEIVEFYPWFYQAENFAPKMSCLCV